MVRVALIIPVLNPGPLAEQLVDGLLAQTRRPDTVLVIDSASTDGWVKAFTRVGARVRSIRREEFDHGGTRNLAFDEVAADVYVFMTQDALPADPWSLERLLEMLDSDPRIGAAFGRQLPSSDAGLVASHVRSYYYPPESRVTTLADVPRLGVRAAFCSNSFSAYRAEAIADVGRFPDRNIFGEDTHLAARLLANGWKVGYAADARVVHSHDYSVWQDFRRDFDFGVFHAENPWYLDFLGRPEGEGVRFVTSEWRHLRSTGRRFALPRVLLRNAVRWVGYMTGRYSRLLPRSVSRRLSTNKAYWR